MVSRRRFLTTVGAGVFASSLSQSGAAVAAPAMSQSEDFRTELEDRGFVEYSPSTTSLIPEGETPDGEGQYSTRIYNKEALSAELREKSNREMTRPGAVFFEQELSGDWTGSWNVDASLGEVPEDTQYVLNNTNNIDLSLIRLNFAVFSPKVSADYTKKNTEIENQTVGKDGDSESLVSKQAIGHIVSSFESLLLDLQCTQHRYADGLWQEMRAGQKMGKTFVAHDEEIDYSKPGHAMTHRTYNAEWKDAEDHLRERIDDDIFNTHVNIRGYLSIESRGGDRSLAVGGFYVNEDSVEFDHSLPSFDETVEIDSDGLQTDILQLMQARMLS